MQGCARYVQQRIQRDSGMERAEEVGRENGRDTSRIGRDRERIEKKENKGARSKKVNAGWRGEEESRQYGDWRKKPAPPGRFFYSRRVKWSLMLPTSSARLKALIHSTDCTSGLLTGMFTLQAYELSQIFSQNRIRRSK